MLGALPTEWRCALGVKAPNITAFLVREFVVSVSGQGGVPPCPGCTRLSRGTRPLRPHASLLHKAAFYKVCASRCAKAPLGVTHRYAPYRVYKIGLMQSGLRWRWVLSSAVHQSGASRFVVVSGLWPFILCLPPPTRGPCRCAASAPARGTARPPPKGAPSAHAGRKTLNSSRYWSNGTAPPTRISRIRAFASSPTSEEAARGGVANPRIISPWRGLSTWP